jgi:drug/metabolite transporter (DMT)-like permease
MMAPFARTRAASRAISPRMMGQITLLIACIVWGANFSAMNLLLRRVEPLDLAMARTSIAATGFIALLLLMRRGLPRFTRGEWSRLISMGLLGVAVVNVASSFGQNVLPASISSLLITSNPIFTAIFAGLLGMERMDRRLGFALALATAGLFTLVAWGGSTSLNLDRTTLVAAGILLLAPLSWAGYTVINKPMLVRHAPLEMAAYGMIIGAIMLLPVGLYDPGSLGRLAAMDVSGWLLLLFSAIGSLIIGLIAYSRALQVLTPSETAMSTYLIPVFGVLIAWAVLGERPTPGLLAGGVMILAAMTLVTTRRQPPMPDVPPVIHE